MVAAAPQASALSFSFDNPTQTPRSFHRSEPGTVTVLPRKARHCSSHPFTSLVSSSGEPLPLRLMRNWSQPKQYCANPLYLSPHSILRRPFDPGHV